MDKAGMRKKDDVFGIIDDESGLFKPGELEG